MKGKSPVKIIGNLIMLVTAVLLGFPFRSCMEWRGMQLPRAA